MYIRTGMVHLLNTISGEFTPSERVFDTIRGGVGGFLEENVEKLLKKHDRRPGKFKENSKLKQVFEDYQKNKVSFEDLCYKIGERLYDKKNVIEIREESILFILDGRPGKFKENSKLKQVFEDYQKNKVSFEDLCYKIGERLYDKKNVIEIREESILFILDGELKQVFEDYQKNKVSFEDLCYKIGERLYDKKNVIEIREESILFILDGGFDGQNLIIGLEIQRRPGYVIENGVSDGKGVNRVYANHLIIPPIRQKNCRLFTVDINTLGLSDWKFKDVQDT